MKNFSRWKKGLLIMGLSILFSFSLFSQSFITTWQTTNNGLSGDDQIIIPTHPGSQYFYNVSWGDDTYDYGVTGDISHTFTDGPGAKTIVISGLFPRIYFDNGGDKEKITGVVLWGNNPWTSMENAFFGCSNLQVNAADVPNLSNVQRMSYMFANCINLTSDISAWDVSHATNMRYMFYNATSFNSNIGSWIVSSVSDMSGMFRGASSFNQDIGQWNVSNVQNMSYMFYSAINFNKNVGLWEDISSVNNMSYMFYNAISFNQNLGQWNDVASVTNMKGMFYKASLFNQDISGWDVSNVSNMSYMFNRASSFDKNIGAWVVSSVGTMRYMFYYANSFDQDIGDWSISNVTDMYRMFHGVTLSTNNYDAIINRMVQLNPPARKCFF